MAKTVPKFGVNEQIQFVGVSKLEPEEQMLISRLSTENYQKIKVQLGVGNRDQLKLLSPSNLKSSSMELSFNIRRFLEFYKGFQNVDDSIKPVMLYYGMQYLFSSVSKPFLKFDKPAPHHGIMVQKGGYKKVIQKQ